MMCTLIFPCITWTYSRSACEELRYHCLSQASPGDRLMITQKSLSSGGVSAGVQTE
jgi:hypothetical protein